LEKLTNKGYISEDGPKEKVIKGFATIAGEEIENDIENNLLFTINKRNDDNIA
jgi:hypothetical protein